MRKTILILTVACLLTAVACQKATTPAPEFRKYQTVADVPKISVQDAKKEVDAGTAIIVDSRAESAYKFEHIAGSINLPVGSTEDKFSVLPKDKNILIYCSCATEATSMALALQINQKGIANTYAIVGGTNAWHQAGYPMEKGQ